jgi:hypothetical protein
MAEFGQPQRTATSDANAGFVNPPALREADRSAQSQSVKVASDLDSATKNFGASMGKAFEEVLHKKANNINEQRQLAASIRQGEGKAINAIDVEKKRSGWSEALFGQNIEYREAQKRAVGNNVQQSYLEQANKISEFAAETGPQYKARLQRQLDDQLKNFPNDPETRQVITDNWAKASEKLVQSQTKEHFGYTAQQERETTQKQVRGTFDTFTTESQTVTTPEEAQEFAEAGKRFFSGAAKPAGASREAYHSVIREEIEYSLAQGNIGAYNMAKEYGYFDNSTKEQRRKLDVAIGKYDTKFKQGIGISVAESKLAVSEISGVDAGEQLTDIMAQANDALVAHEGRASGTNASKLALANARNSMYALQAPAIKAAAKAQATAKEALDLEERMALVTSALDDANEGSGASLASIDATKSEIEAATASRINNLVGDLVGEDAISTKDAIGKMLADPTNVGAKVVSQWGMDEFDSDIVKHIGRSYVNGFMSSIMVDENQQPTQAAQNAMQLMSQFEAKDRAKFRTQLGDKAFEEFQIIKAGQSAGKPSDMITRDIKAAEDARGKQNYYAADWRSVGVYGGEGGLNKREFIENKVFGLTGQYPTGTDVGDYLEIYGRGLEAGKGDHQTAHAALFDATKNKSAIFNGQVINNADKVNATLTDYTLPQLLAGIQRPDVNLMTGLLTVGMGNTEDENGNPIRTINDKALRGSVKFEVASDGGLWMKSPKFQSDVYVPPHHIQTFERVLKQQDNNKKLQAEIKEENFIKGAQKSIDAQQQFNR